MSTPFTPFNKHHGVHEDQEDRYHHGRRRAEEHHECRSMEGVYEEPEPLPPVIFDAS
jgi:hypothetical protein